MSDVLGPGPKTRVRRLAAKANYERDVIFAVIDEAPLCHVAAIVQGNAMVIRRCTRERATPSTSTAVLRTR